MTLACFCHGRTHENMPIKNYYDVLDLSPTATSDEIKEAYRLLVSMLHPDKFPLGSKQQQWAHTKLQSINEAYSVLKDPQQRSQYDSETAQHKQADRDDDVDQFVSGNAPDPNASVWPPPPMGQPQAAQPLAVCPFKWTYRRAPGKLAAKANIADLREGVLQFDPDGVIIQGKAVPRAEIRALVLIPCVLISLLLAVIANSLMEYAFRQDQYLGVRWSSVREVLLAPDKQQACLIYDAPNYAGKIKNFSLAFTPTPGYYESLVQAVRQYAPVPVAEDRLRMASSPVLLAVLAALVVGVIFFILWAAISPHH